MTFTISDLRRQPALFDAVADRVWRAWWKDRGFSAAYIVGRLQENMGSGPMPLALVAHDGGTFLGTASVIASDLEERAQYSPWVAAVWVDPEYRGKQVGRALVARAASEVFALGMTRAYLCAPEHRRDFYLRQGWVPVEENVGIRKVTLFVKEAG